MVQAIIPREAARSILMGEASYTLIDDHGVEFYLSPKDKKNRKKQVTSYARHLFAAHSADRHLANRHG